jgi:hypothetical protein
LMREILKYSGSYTVFFNWEFWNWEIGKFGIALKNEVRTFSIRTAISKFPNWQFQNQNVYLIANPPQLEKYVYPMMLNDGCQSRLRLMGALFIL